MTTQSEATAISKAGPAGDEAVGDPVAGDAVGDTAPPFRYTAALAAEIEARWQDRWEAEGTFEAPNPAGPLAPADGRRSRPTSCICWTCSRTRPARACTSGTHWATSAPT